MDPELKTTRRVRGTPREVQIAARRLRRELTPAERVLWDALRDRQLDGLGFRRQAAMGPFVLDFYCPAHRLAIELDGDVHDEGEQVEHDAARTEQLNRYRYRVIRFRNDEVFSDLPSVLQRILEAVEEMTG